ncbi:uncharacterized protein ACRADG_004882 [Cochliomyia hominivorax]
MSSKMFCPLGSHLLRGSGVFITNPRLIRFVNKFFPDFLPFEKVCEKCKQDIGIAYEYKMKRAIASRALNASQISSNTTDESTDLEKQTDQRNTNTAKVQKRSLVPVTSTSTEDDDGQPSTSVQAAAKRKRIEERQKSKQKENPLAINIQRGARLPHIQPVAKRRQFVHANPDIMDIYIRGMTGG